MVPETAPAHNAHGAFNSYQNTLKIGGIFDCRILTN
jgi:hypothetical protein